MRVKLSICLVAIVAIMTFGISNPASALHDGGVAHCDACHSMHQSADNPISGTPNQTLLKGSDASSTCLNCHSGSTGYHISSTDGSNLNAGGDFYWMQANFATPPPWGGAPAGVSDPDNFGHNIVAADYGFAVDANPANATAPGGTYQNINLGCNSCHDAHGRVGGGTANGGAPISVSGSYGAADPVDGSIHGNYRLLADAGFVAPGGVAFTAAAPVATADNGAYGGFYGQSVDYGQGMSEFCANCHNTYMGDPNKHAAGNNIKATLNGYAGNYNQYIKTGDFNGVQATANDGMVPFERGESDGALLDPASTIGPEADDYVMCLTCHRAHASANPNAGRWDFEHELLADAAALGSGDLDPTTQGIIYANGAIVDVVATYGEYQRSLCNKCHVKD
jgi:hypothetical protein